MPMTKDRAAFVVATLRNALALTEQLYRELAAMPPAMTTPTSESVALVATPQPDAAEAASPRVPSRAVIAARPLRGQAVDDAVVQKPDPRTPIEQVALIRVRSRATLFSASSVAASKGGV